jgi:hypothetical protein
MPNLTDTLVPVFPPGPLDAPVVNGDFDTWGIKLNSLLQQLNDRVNFVRSESNFQVETYILAGPSPTTLTLTYPPIDSKTLIFVNGLAQSPNSYTITTNTINLPNTLDLISGDEIIVQYYFRS